MRLHDELFLDIELGLPGIHNAENALGCIALLVQLGYEVDDLRASLKSFTGVKRRFEYHLRSENLIYIDDYAHHPTEINALITSVRSIYPELPVIGIFQPHLYSRTKDFAQAFALSLAALDQLYLLPIYPAREEPIHGVTSEWLLDAVALQSKVVMSSHEILLALQSVKKGVVLTIGAGDIDRMVKPVTELLKIQITNA